MLNRLLLGWLGLLLLAGPLHAARPAGPRVVLAVDGIAEPRNLPVLLAQQLGYFREAGLVVTLVDAPAVPSVAQLTADGRADGAVAYYHHTFMTQAQDGITRAVAVLGVTPAQRLMVASRLRDRVHSIADLKGMRIITGGSNSGKTTATNWAFLHAGLTIRDYTPLPVMKRDAAARALSDGSADAIMTHEPDAAFYEAQGAAFELADLATPAGTRAALGSLYPSTALYLPSDYIDAHPSEVKALVGALIRALRYIESHDAAAIAAALPPKVGGPDRAAFTRQLAADKAMFDGDGRIDPAAAAAELRAMTALEPKYGRVKLAETYTNAFVDAAARR